MSHVLGFILVLIGVGVGVLAALVWHANRMNRAESEIVDRFGMRKKS